MNALILTSLTETSGLGNIRRAKLIRENFLPNWRTKFIVHSEINPAYIREICADDNFLITSSLSDVLSHVAEFNLMIVDIDSKNLDYFFKQTKHRNPTIKISALDYFHNHEYLDLRISLFNQTTERFDTSEKDHLVGLQYAVLPERVNREADRLHAELLIRTSGQGNLLLNEFIDSIGTDECFENFKFTLLQHSNLTDKTPILPQENFLSKLARAKVYIGSGITTLLTCALNLVPCIFVPANSKELKFASALETKGVNICIPRDITHLKNMMLDIETKEEAAEKLIPNIPIDDLGVKRVIEKCQALI